MWLAGGWVGGWVGEICREARPVECGDGTGVWGEREREIEKEGRGEVASGAMYSEIERLG